MYHVKEKDGQSQKNGPSMEYIPSNQNIPKSFIFIETKVMGSTLVSFKEHILVAIIFKCGSEPL